MSRIGRKPITIPEGVNVEIGSDNTITRLAEDGPVPHAELRCTHSTKTDAGGTHPPGPTAYSVLHLPPSPPPSQP